MGGSSFLNAGTTFAIFYLSGTQPEEKDELYRYASDSVIAVADFLEA